MKKNHFFFLAVLIVIQAFKVHAQTGTWTALSSGTTNNFLGVSAPSTSIAYVSGFAGDIRKTTNGGLSWIPETSGTPENLYSVFFTDVLTGYAVGDNGAAIKTTNGGTTWTPMSLSTSDDLRSVWFFDTNNGFITGGVASISGSIFKTTDGGATWTSLTISSTSMITSIYFTSLTNGYATGFAGSVFKTVSGGTSWGTIASGTTSLQGINFTSATDGVVISQTGAIRRSTTSGTSWSAVASGTTNTLSGMDFYDASNGVVVGGNAPSDTGMVITTADGGVTWAPTSIPSCTRLIKVAFYDANTGYAVGLGGTILKWAIPLPPTPPHAAFTSSAPGCQGQNVNFYSVMSGIPGVTHSWNFGLGATPATSASINPTGVSYSTYGVKIVTHITTTSLGSDTVTNLITINPSPLASLSSTAPACPGTTVDFSNTGSTGAGVTYSWDLGTGASPLNSTSQNPTGIVYSSSGTKTITLNVTNQYGCLTSAVQTITINPAPVANAGIDSTICAGNSVHLGSAAVAGNTYSWSPAATLSSSAIANPIASPVAPLSQYVVTVTNTSTGCVNHDTVHVTMLSPMMANAGADANICKADSVQLGTGAIAGQIYSWSPSTGLHDTISAHPNASPVATTTYTLTVSGNGCPAATDEVTVSVHAKPVANAGPDIVTTIGTPVQLMATGGEQYSWSPGTGLDDPSIYNPIATPTSVTTYYTVTVTNAYGCRSADIVMITAGKPAFWVPTAFTPDGNGEDDIFYVRGEGIEHLEFTVFNRWGEQIFFTNDINIGWDGNRQSTGEKLPEGAYVYQVKGNLSDGTPILSKGMINLIR